MVARKMPKGRRGKRLTKTGKYEIKAKVGRERSFTGTLLGSVNSGAKRLAIFSVPKGKP